MTKPTIRHGDWIVVCDGRKALLLENEGDEVFANFKTHEVFEHETRANRELSSDRPGRVQEMTTTARSAIEPADYHLQEEAAFLTKISARLAVLVTAKTAHRIAIVAPPRALGILRKTYTPAVRAAICAEIDHDLVHLPVYEIEKHLAGRPAA
jgi:protein required for attachment to host cells